MSSRSSCQSVSICTQSLWLLPDCSVVRGILQKFCHNCLNGIHKQSLSCVSAAACSLLRAHLEAWLQHALHQLIVDGRLVVAVRLLQDVHHRAWLCYLRPVALLSAAGLL